MDKQRIVLTSVMATGIAGAYALYSYSQPRRTENIPETMECLVINKPATDLNDAIVTKTTRPVPVPRTGQVLIKVTAAPVNPSDIGSIRFPASRRTSEPAQFGNECSGVVVATGGGFGPASVFGKHVACVARGSTAYSEYVVANYTEVFALPSSIKVEDACGYFVNPFTVLAIISVAKANGQKTILHTAAASALGKMLVQVAPRFGVEVVNIVRRQGQADLLEALGAKTVLVSTDENFTSRLSGICKDKQIGIAFDAVGGPMTGVLSAAMVNRSKVVVYGILSDEPVSGVAGLDLIYRGKSVEGLMLRHWLQKCSLFTLWRTAGAVRSMISDEMSTTYEDCTMETFMPKVLEAFNGASITGRKLRLRLD